MYSNGETKWGRKKYSKELKARIRKKQLIDAAPVSFSNGKDKDAEKKDVKRDHLYKKVHQLQVEFDWLKKDRLSGMRISEQTREHDVPGRYSLVY